MDNTNPYAHQKNWAGIAELAQAAGVSTRTLRYYESCGLIAPARAENGYRIYAPSEVKRLAQILSMKRCGLPLATIKQLVSNDEGNIRDVLKDHLCTLQAQGASLEMAITRTKAAIAAIERIEKMDVKDAFEKMKEEGLKTFEDTYGKEARERYGDATIDASNERMMALTKDEWEAKELLEDAIKVQLRIALQTQDPQSEAAQELAHMHEKWIAIHWGNGYKEQAYLGLVQGYLNDPRFVSYYDSAADEGATEFLVQAIKSAHK